jgi:integration host factor subunit beta
MNQAEQTSMNDSSTVTKADLVEQVVRVTELPRKESEAVVETIFESIIGALQGGDRIEIRGFGSFRTRQRRGRTGRNPKTGAKVEVPPKKIPFFKPSKELKDFVNTNVPAGAGSPSSPGAPPQG